MTWHDTAQLDACRALLVPATAVFVSHIPGQTWEQSLQACVAIRKHGFEPVPHIPVRRLADAAALELLAADLVARASVTQVLLIAGDLPKASGTLATTMDALRTGLLAAHGLRRVVVAGHPEGHPVVSVAELRRAEREKLEFAAAHGIELTFLTQFSFEATPFFVWARRLRGAGVYSRLISGLAGPARLSALFRYAVRCGVGSSIRALGARPDAFTALLGERGPETLVRELARATLAGEIDNAGMHLYAFGGLLRTCRWLNAVADGRFELDERDGFAVAAD